MDQNSLSPVVVAAALSACAMEAELLNSERIERRFGNYGVEIISQSDVTRRSNLFSVENSVRTCRTYAVVQFRNNGAKSLADVHAAVLAGQSIGSTLVDHGWAIDKRTMSVGDIPSTEVDHSIIGLMRLDEPGPLALHRYELHLERNDESIHYATIIELHHPGYLGAEELSDIYDADIGDLSSVAERVASDALLAPDR